MALTEAEQARLFQHINQKWRNKFCFQCSANTWSVDATVKLILGDSKPTGIVLGGSFQPYATMTCTNCGNTLLINLIVAGVVVPGADR